MGESFVITNDTLLSVTLLALFLLLSFELLEYFGTKLFSHSPKLVHHRISSTQPTLKPHSFETQAMVEDPVLKTMDTDGYVTPSKINSMIKEFPNETRRTLTRFLIARKGCVEAASSMLKSSLLWRKENLKSMDEVRNAFKAKALFCHSTSKSGTNVIYFRGALYDRTIASTTDYVKAAAHIIDQQFIDEVAERKPYKVVVLIHTAYVEGGINAPADLGFIKEFVKVLSDNFPERLDRLVIYPFPWFGRAIWSVAKTFMDPRTVNKVVLLAQGPDGEHHCPPGIGDYVDLSKIPTICGGNCRSLVHYPLDL